jgi:spore germination cell wall hydrolase CwlJ-like protein
MMNLDVTDLDFVARTVMAEAEGEPYEGKLAVAAVIYNRANKPGWWGTTVKDACLTSYQFSAWNENSPRRNKIGEWSMDDVTFRDCMRAAIEGIDNDPTDGADHYYAHEVIPPPSWAEALQTRVIGGHTFVRRYA